MAITNRYTLSTTPTKIDVSGADDISIIAQADGTIIICDASGTDPTSEGARLPVVAGQVVAIDDIGGAEDVWLAVASSTLDIDVVEWGVNS